MAGSNLFITGKVEYVEGDNNNAFSDIADGLRLKVRVDSDGDIGTMDLPWAFPANPKMLHVIPKVGEGVFILNSQIGNPESQRLYIGPIISQPQYMEKCEYDSGPGYGSKSRGPAMSLLSTQKVNTVKPLTAISRKKDMTYGAFPDVRDVALLGRGQEDIVLKYRNYSEGPESEIDLRAGIRLEPTDTTIPYLNGNVVFNNTNPGYIQIKYGKNGLSGLKSGSGDDDDDKYESISERTANSVVNIVADKINIISHKDSNQFGGKMIANKDDLIERHSLDELMSNLHRGVYGDELIVLLKKIVEVLVTHVHPFAMKKPVYGGTYIPELIAYEYEKILSPNVRIS